MPTRRPWWRIRVRWVLTRTLALYFLSILVLSGACMLGCADKLLLIPSRNPIEVSNASARLIAAPSGNVQVWVGQTRTDRPPEGFVLDFIGNGSRAEYEMERILPVWAEHPVEVWIVNYPGYGGSDGAARMASIPPAALAVYDVLAGQAAGRPIFVQGHSIGTTAALYVAAQRPVAGAVLHNPPPLRQLIMGRFGWWNLWLGASAVARAVPVEMDSLPNGARCTAPAVFLLAQRDALVTPPYQKQVVDAYAGPKQIVPLPDAGHNNAVEGPYLPTTRAQINWLWDRALTSTSPSQPQRQSKPLSE